MRGFLQLVLLCGTIVHTTQLKAQGSRAQDTVKWKLLFQQLLASEIKRESPDDAAFQRSLRAHTSFTPNSFNQTLNEVLAATTSEEAFAKRQAVYANPYNYQTLASLDFDNIFPSEIRSRPPVAKFLDEIENSRNRRISTTDNYFESAESKAMINALTYAKGGGKQDVAFIMVPGFASHTTKFEIFPDIVEDMNEFQGRPKARPYKELNAMETEFQNVSDFYSAGSNDKKTFDILHPAGAENGNSVGPHQGGADLLAKWIRELPPVYANKKLILLGYSKGSPIIFHMLNTHADIKARVLGVVTAAGVVQGTHIARFGVDLLTRLGLGNNSAEVLNDLRLKGLDGTNAAVSQLLTPLNQGFMNIPSITQTLRAAGIDVQAFQERMNSALGAREATQILGGIASLSPATTMMWNVKNFDNSMVAPGTFVFNLSGITDISDWATRPADRNTQTRSYNSFVPELNEENRVDFKKFSIDDIFLYITSVKGFRLAPGGLYDTQVELAHSKSPWLDSSPLSDSLTATEIQAIWADPQAQAKLRANGTNSAQELASKPRNQLVRPENRSNMFAYDLGEFRGHHWSLFGQAFKAPPAITSDSATHVYPRKAFMRALLQTIALYNLVNQSN